jgi:sugar phosphate isomerase/epimerase
LKPITIQLYTVRDYAAKDFPGTLRQIAEIGYKGVETAGLYGHDVKEINQLIKDLGMQVCSSHGPLPTPENIQQIVDTESALGNKTAISGFGPGDMDTMDKVKACAEKFQIAADLCKQNGMTFGFHNHWWEFHSVDGKRVYDILMAEAPDAFSELDVYWTAYGKADPVAVVSQYKSRLPYIHIKDGTLEENKPHTAVGSGKLDIPGIIGASDPNVTKWLVVELDSCATDMMEAVRQSYQYLTSNKLAEGNK